MADFYDDEMYMSRWTEPDLVNGRQLIGGKVNGTLRHGVYMNNAIVPTSIIAALAVVSVCLFLFCLLTTVKCLASWCVGVLLDPEDNLLAHKQRVANQSVNPNSHSGSHQSHTNHAMIVTTAIDFSDDDDYMLDDYRPIVTEDPDL